ncbi:unnamed protein product [Caenorhabditis auriculariae]|uniref:Chitin-binding type-2 domain-containing protein n=1 Tax=Caenorhabditis auriculariae TaxID=2777116 RepID=A0A8S1H4Z5_9PELO|nr:unnamed protein product [Caenorhabditis auriculariae]
MMIPLLLLFLLHGSAAFFFEYLQNVHSWQVTPICQEGERFPGETCETFLQCRHGQIREHKCPNGLGYSERLRECSREIPCQNRVCRNSEKTVALDKNGKVVCDFYFSCEKNDWRHYRCPQGTVFDPKAKECLLGRCKDEREDGYGVPPEEPPVPFGVPRTDDLGIELAEYIARSCDGKTLIADRHDCRRFWRCSSSGFFVSGICVEGTVYSHRKRRCVRGNQCENDQVCPAGEFLPSDVCGEYKFCYKNEWTSGFCDHNMSFMNGTCGPQYCKKYSADLNYASRVDCRHGDVKPSFSDWVTYQFCYYGKWQQRECPANHFFDREILRCVRAPSSPPTLPPPPTCYNGEFRPIPNDPNQYEECQNNEWRRRYCPYGLTFRNGYCVEDQQLPTTCVEREGQANYRTVPHDCNSFYQCAQGRWMKRPCAAGTVWNERISVCDHARNVPRCNYDALIKL